MKIKNICILIIGLFLILTASISVSAYDLPSVNLGFTSFMDGAPPSGPGVYFTQYLQYWKSDEFKNPDGDPAFLPDAGEDLEAWISLSQITYQSDTEIIWGGKWGIDVLVPYVILDLDYDNPNPLYPQDNGSGIGDIWVGPYLQWDPIMGENGPKFMHRFSLGFVFPTGSYDSGREVNQGSNVFSFNPYWAATYFVNPKWTMTTRIYYLLNDENDEPGHGLDTSKAGQALHINFASAYEIIPQKLRLGINGYYLKQISDSEADGVSQPGKEQVLGIGPGLLYSMNKDAHFFLNIYKETSAELRPEGTRINVRFVYHF